MSAAGEIFTLLQWHKVDFALQNERHTRIVYAFAVTQSGFCLTKWAPQAIFLLFQVCKYDFVIGNDHFFCVVKKIVEKRKRKLWKTKRKLWTDFWKQKINTAHNNRSHEPVGGIDNYAWTVFFNYFLPECQFFGRPSGAENDYRKSQNKNPFLEFWANFSFWVCHFLENFRKNLKNFVFFLFFSKKSWISPNLQNLESTMQTLQGVHKLSSF